MRRILSNLLATLISLVITAFGLELLTRLMVDDGMQFDLEMWKYAREVKQVATDPLIGHEHASNRQAHLMGVDFRTNSQGLRDREFSFERAPGKLRIAMLGDSLTVGWGVRNVAELDRAFGEMARVTRPGGRVVCLEATMPASAWGRRFHAVWFDRVVPAMGALAGAAEAYAYLPASVRSFPDADGLAAVMKGAGLTHVRYQRLGLGAMALHVGERAA